MRLHTSTQQVSPKQGSALLPLVAAMLILLLTGVALSETFGAQRMQSVMDVEATRALWIAEAGLWHAAHEETAISTPVNFGGGQYAVAKNNGTYISKGVRGAATRSVSRAMRIEAEGGPIDVPTSISTLDVGCWNRFSLDLFSIWPEDIVLESFELSHDGDENYKVKRLKLENRDIWYEYRGLTMPTGVVALNRGCHGDITIESFDNPTLTVESTTEPDRPVTYTLVLHFTYGGQSTLVFTVPWVH